MSPLQNNSKEFENEIFYSDSTNSQSIIEKVEKKENEASIFGIDEDKTKEMNIMKDETSKMVSKNEFMEFIKIYEQRMRQMNQKIEVLSNMVLDIQLREHSKSLVDNIYNAIFKCSKKDSLNFQEKIDEILNFIILKYKPDKKKDLKRYNIFLGLVQFLKNIKEKKVSEDNFVHPKSISKLVIPEAISEKIKSESNNLSMNDLIILAYSDNYQSKLKKLIDEFQILSFGRFGKEINQIIIEYLDEE